MNIVTREFVKTLKGTSGVNEDAAIDSLIPAVSQAAERLMGRHIEDTTRTETLRLGLGTTRIWLAGFPTSTVTSVKLVRNPNDLSSASALAATSYWLDGESGVLELLSSRVDHDPMYMQVAYTGGMAADTAAFMAAEQEVVNAAAYQIIHEIQRRRTPGGSSALIEGGNNEMHSGELNLLKIFRGACAARKRTLW